MFRRSTRSAKVPPTAVGKELPSIMIVGPLPQGRSSGVLGAGLAASVDVTAGIRRADNPTGRSPGAPVEGTTAALVSTWMNWICRRFVVKPAKVTRPPPFGTSTIRVSFPSEIEISVGGDASRARVNSREETSTGVPQAKSREGAVSPSPAIQGVDDRSTTF